MLVGTYTVKVNYYIDRCTLHCTTVRIQAIEYIVLYLHTYTML